jgi:hypothetical protein
MEKIIILGTLLAFAVSTLYASETAGTQSGTKPLAKKATPGLYFVTASAVPQEQ